MDVFISSIYSNLPELPSWILVSLGFYFSYRILKFPDITVDASFTAGMVSAAVGAVFIKSSIMGLILAILLGGSAGALTGMLFILNPKPAYKLLAGLFVVFIFYSINYRLLQKQITKGFSNEDTFYNKLQGLEMQYSIPLRFIVGIIICICIMGTLIYFFKTGYGIVLRSVGSRPQNEGIKVRRYYIMGLIVSNAIVSVGGWVFGSYSNYATVAVFGYILHAVAIGILGEMIVDYLPRIKDKRSTPWALIIAPILGAVLYFLIRSTIAFFMVDKNGEQVSINSYDQKAVLSFIIIIALLIFRYFSNNRGFLINEENE